jgi:hypothetical protein
MTNAPDPGRITEGNAWRGWPWILLLVAIACLLWRAR